MHITGSECSLLTTEVNGVGLYLWTGYGLPGIHDLELGIFPQHSDHFKRHELSEEGILNPDRTILAVGDSIGGEDTYLLQRILARSGDDLSEALEFTKTVAAGASPSGPFDFDPTNWRADLYSCLKNTAEGCAYMAVDDEDPEHGTYASTVPNFSLIEGCVDDEEFFHRTPRSEIPEVALWVDAPQEW